MKKSEMEDIISFMEDADGYRGDIAMSAQALIKRLIYNNKKLRELAEESLDNDSKDYWGL